VVTNYFPALTETFIYREIEGLARHGIPVQVYSVRRPPEKDVSANVRALRRQTSYLLPMKWSELAGSHLSWLIRRPLRYVSTLLLVLFGEHHRLWDRVRSLSHFAEGVVVASRARRDGVGLLHAHYASHPATIALTAARLCGIPFSFTGHAYDIWEDRLCLPQKLAACRFAVTCTEAGRRALLAAAPLGEAARVSTIYHGVDVERFHPGPRRPGREFTILSVSRLDRPKGHHLLLDALAALAKEGHPFRVRIVGDGPERSSLEEQAARLGLSARVEFTGRVFHERLPDHYREADLFVLPCYKEGGYQDNLPNVLLEAMACGVPAISTRQQGIPELIEDGVSGLLTQEKDTAALTSAIRRCLEDRAFAVGLGRAARRRVVESFDHAASVRRLAALYRSQLAGGRAVLKVVPRPAQAPKAPATNQVAPGRMAPGKN
jgi:glycosyltransferase involved in cell wall biosynthesis